MSDVQMSNGSGPYITEDLRPRVVPQLETLAPTDPNADAATLKEHALKVLRLTESEWLALHPEYGEAVTWEQSFTRNPDVTWNTLDHETVLLNVITSQYYTLNRIATVIWELFEGDRTLGSIVDNLCENYDVRRSEIERDLSVLARQLHFEGLLKPGD